MTGERNGSVPGPSGKTYKDAVLVNLPPSPNRGTPSDLYGQLIESLKDLMARNPCGVSVNQARRCCPLLSHPQLLQQHPSIRHLLASMTTVVELDGVGVQTRVLPAKLSFQE